MEMGRGDVGESLQSLKLNQSMERRVGEELIIDKINKIFDEVAKDRDEFESTYVDHSQKAQTQKKILDRSAQVHETSLLGGEAKEDQAPVPNSRAPIPQPLVMPIIINQGDKSAHSTNQAFPDLNMLRDLISQAVSSQLQLHSIR